MARKPMPNRLSLASDSRAKHYAPFDLFVTQIDTDWDEPSESIIDEMNASLMSKYDNELTPRERAMRRMGV